MSHSHLFLAMIRQGSNKGAPFYCHGKKTNICNHFWHCCKTADNSKESLKCILLSHSAVIFAHLVWFLAVFRIHNTLRDFFVRTYELASCTMWRENMHGPFVPLIMAFWWRAERRSGSCGFCCISQTHLNYSWCTLTESRPRVFAFQ